MCHTIRLSGIPGVALAPGLSTAATLSSFLVSDQTRDEIQLATDLNGDGDTNDAGEASVWFSGAANAASYPLNTPNGIAEGPDGAIYVVEADTAGSPTGDWVYRTVDLNGDGDANDAGEATRWLDLKALNAASSPFEIRFDGDTAFVIDSAGATPNTISRVRDHDGDGGIEGPEVSLFATDATTGAVFDFAMDVGPGSAWTWQWLPANGLSSVFRLTDLDGSGTIDPSETFEVWNTSLLDPMFTFLAGFGLALNEATGEILISSNAGADTGTWIARLLDPDGDGAFWGAGESRVVLSLSEQGTVPQRPHNVAFYAPAPVPLPASLPLLAVPVGGLAWLRRNRAGKP